MASSGPFILGLTGSIGMGKSTTATMLRDFGVDVLDSDAVVHKLYTCSEGDAGAGGSGGAAVPLVEAAFPGVTVDGCISRPLLSKYVVGSPDALKRLESIVHPLVQAEKQKFVAAAAQRGASLVVLDVPLLFETGAEAACDAVAVVSAPLEVQKERVLARPGMTEDKFDQILARQMPDAEKRTRAHFIIDTGVSLEETREHVAALIEGLRGRQGKAYLTLLR